MAKKTRFAFRTTEEFKKRIADVAETLGLDQAVVGEAALEAVVAHVEQYGELTIPIRLERKPAEPNIYPLKKPGDEHAESARAAEDSPKFKAKRKSG